ncbi:MAG: 3-isopropylmalate dehydratase [Polyangiaceae bacterium]|nr:3-isopropylmalate dehydratase [Polyangiaceae bacterium]MCW5791907.1 3-isopropylmalate dehydratase [Polyangiaceae bacterium]
MRARAGDPPRTMPQKILAGRSDDPQLQSDTLKVKVDQVVLARDPSRTLQDAAARGLRKAAVETAVVYDTHCVTQRRSPAEERGGVEGRVDGWVQQGLLWCRPGIGFPAAVHLERFGSPARLSITDEPRMAAVGGIGMLSLVVSPSELASALATGTVRVRTPRSVQVLLSGRIRPFVCIRDVALELLRRGLAELIERVDRTYGAPVVLEFAGPSARLLPVADRAVLCSLAPQLGAASAVFVSDEKTEVYLRDQRRSKAHRALNPDNGAPCDDVLSVDLSAVDPLVLDETGEVKAVRELKGKPVRQVILGGDTGAGLRDILAAALLLKSKRVPPKLDLLLAPPSRQVLEVLAKTGALVDLIATGARLIEPDQRILTGELYPPPPGGLSLRTFDSDPGAGHSLTAQAVVASAETLAYTVAHGEVGDPRGFKRPVRVTVPRALPTDDVLVVRKGKGKVKTDDDAGATVAHPAVAWSGPTELAVVAGKQAGNLSLAGPSLVVCAGLAELSALCQAAPRLTPQLRAVLAPHVPSGFVPLLSGLGVLALRAEPEVLQAVTQATQVGVPAPDAWPADAAFSLQGPGGALTASWLAAGEERAWVARGAAHVAAPVLKTRK